MADPERDVSDAVAERVARNDAIFRDANEKIRGVAENHDVVGRIPFLCECAKPSCREILLLTIPEYEEIRSNSTHFLNVPGHEVNAQGWARVAADRGHYVIVEKIGRAGEIATDLDPRA